MNIDAKAFTIDCTGDAVTGDTVLFEEMVWGGSYRRPTPIGKRRIAARIVKDSYGAAKQQHTFTLEIIASDGTCALTPGTKTTRKGRNVYRNGTRRMVWDDEAAREIAADEKHHRGDFARAIREQRRAAEIWY